MSNTTIADAMAAGAFAKAAKASKHKQPHASLPPHPHSPPPLPTLASSQAAAAAAASSSFNPLRPYHSESSLLPGPSASEQRPTSTLRLKSEPVLSTRKAHPLLDTDDDHTQQTYNELILSAETLENIVNEGTFVGPIRSRSSISKMGHARGQSGGEHEVQHAGREMSDRVLKLVYGTMKFLPYIDHILVKTQFLVFNNQFLNHLGLVKVMLFDLMKHHFDYRAYPGIAYDMPTAFQTKTPTTRSTLDESLRSFQIKLGAAYARLRIEKRAAGSTMREQMENILPLDVREKELMAVARLLEEQGYKVMLQPLSEIPKDTLHRYGNDIISLDEDFDDLLVIPSKFFAELKAGKLVTEGYCRPLIWLSLGNIQDKASGMQIIDARAGCGTKTANLAALVGKSGHVYAFENRAGRLETLRANMKLFECSNVTIVEDDFAQIDTHDARFADVTAIVLEPSNSGTAIVDKLGFMLQEEEFPSDQPSLKDLYALKRQQITILKHAFKFPNVKCIMYITRSTHPEENEQVVQETLDRYGVEWELSCVLPNIIVDHFHDYEMDECLTVLGTSRRVSDLNIHELHEQDADHGDKGKKKRSSKTRQRNSKVRITANIKLPKAISESVQRLSVPRTMQIELKKKQQLELLQRERKMMLDRANAVPVRMLVAEGLARVKRTGRTTGRRWRTGRDSTAWLKSGGGGGSMESLEGRSTVGSRARRTEYADISVFGVSLAKFYGPQLDAIKRLQAENDLRWSYPVPNPRPWK
ncbi:hypothetical protein BC831DRAFT_452189 [Entophlyctis helioformis]|nr:hypothetical protein BC831DRAFT_452189 [Entophlyctis helioformis]